MPACQFREEAIGNRFRENVGWQERATIDLARFPAAGSQSGTRTTERARRLGVAHLASRYWKRHSGELFGNAPKALLDGLIVGLHARCNQLGKSTDLTPTARPVILPNRNGWIGSCPQRGQRTHFGRLRKERRDPTGETTNPAGRFRISSVLEIPGWAATAIVLPRDAAAEKSPRVTLKVRVTANALHHRSRYRASHW
jgi:hypothetical protein